VEASGVEVKVNGAGEIAPWGPPVSVGFVAECEGQGVRSANLEVLANDPDEPKTTVVAIMTCNCPEGSSTGDPHLITIDGLRYDLMAVGEFVLVDDGDLLIQVRHGPFRRSKTASVNTEVAARVGTSRVTVYASREPGVRIDGAAASDDTELPGGGRVERSRGTTTITWPEGDVLTTMDRGDHLDLRFTPVAERRGRLKGLLGDYDGDKTDDLVSGDTPLEVPPAYDALHPGYADAWRITQDDALFDYGPGETTETFTDRAFPEGHLTPSSLSAEDREIAEKVCREKGIGDPVILQACIVDVGVSGDPALAESAAEVDAREVGRLDPRSGCADGQREGFEDTALWPDIAGCAASWEGERSLRDPRTGVRCGDDMGECAAPADACAPGWHLCGRRGGTLELSKALTGDQCESAGSGRFVAAVSHCAAVEDNVCHYRDEIGTNEGCLPEGWCSEPVCCGADCGFGECRDGAWPERTHMPKAVGQGCGTITGDAAGGVLCCRDAAPDPPCDPGERLEAMKCVDVASQLHGLRVDMPCASGSGDTCTAAQPKASASATIGGDPGARYEVTLRVRGVLEQMTYEGGSGEGLWRVGGTAAHPRYNEAALVVSAPSQVYWLNAGRAGQARVWGLDELRTLPVDAGATVTLYLDAKDDRLIRNQGRGKRPIVVSGLPPAPEPFDGQFIQVDVVAISEAVTPEDIAGAWSGQTTLLLRAVGDEVHGAYAHDEGTVVATFDDGVLRGWWSEQPSRAPNSDAGEFEFRFRRGMDGTVTSIDGRWRYGPEGHWREDWDFGRALEEPPMELEERFAQPDLFVQHP
jgi:hypothetical protein